jgi:ubiquinone/menaquinone biosynthesis C-methylase UbiE
LTQEYDAANDLLATEAMRLPMMRRAVKMLELDRGGNGLDVGCGAGAMTRIMAWQMGGHGRVTGLDQDQGLLDLAARRMAQAGLDGQVRFIKGGMHSLPFEPRQFDWLVSVDCAGYAPTDQPLELVKELARVLKPGGCLALLAWSSQMLLPGHPGLEARLNATKPGMAPFCRGYAPERHFMRALWWLNSAGLQRCRAATLAQALHAPLAPEHQAGLEALIKMRWAGAEKELGQADAELMRRLTQPDSADYVLKLDDYLAFFTYTMFWGFKKS